MSSPALTRYAPTEGERKAPTRLLPLSAGTAILLLVLNLMGFTSLPAHEMIPTNQYYSPTGTRVYHTLLLLQSLSPTAPDCLPYSQVRPLCGPCIAFSIFLPQAVSMCNQWTSVSLISRNRYCVFGHLHNLKMRIPLCQWGGEEVDKIPIIIRLLKSDGLNKEQVSFPGEHTQKTKSNWLVFTVRVWKEACII